MELPTAEQILIEQRVSNDGPNTVVAYLLWFFLGLLGAHRFYLGRMGSAVAQLLVSIVTIGILGILELPILIPVVWWLVDGFLIPGMLREKREALRQRLTQEAIAKQTPITG